MPPINIGRGLIKPFNKKEEYKIEENRKVYLPTDIGLNAQEVEGREYILSITCCNTRTTTGIKVCKCGAKVLGVGGIHSLNHTKTDTHKDEYSLHDCPTYYFRNNNDGYEISCECREVLLGCFCHFFISKLKNTILTQLESVGYQ